MKQNILTLLLVTIFTSSFAQAPQGIPYQSALRNSSGGILANQNVSIRFSIHDSTSNGNIVYQETHAANTNHLGLVSLQIGTGTPVISQFNLVNWAVNAKFLQIEMIVSGGTSFTDLGTQQMMSVPYALYSNSAGELKQSGSDPQTLIYTGDGF